MPTADTDQFSLNHPKILVFTKDQSYHQSDYSITEEDSQILTRSDLDHIPTASPIMDFSTSILNESDSLVSMFKQDPFDNFITSIKSQKEVSE